MELIFRLGLNTLFLNLTAKAGVVASLPARCSVIAAANPKHGSYNLSRTVAENLNMSKPIRKFVFDFERDQSGFIRVYSQSQSFLFIHVVSRFDLVFVLRDRADKDLDRLVSSNIMNLYRGGSDANGTSTASTAQASTSQTQNDSSSTSTSRLSLSSRLAWVADFRT